MTQGLTHTVDGVGASYHERFMEAAAVEMLAVAIFASWKISVSWDAVARDTQANVRAEARRLITEGVEATSPDPSNGLPPNPRSEGQPK